MILSFANSITVHMCTSGESCMVKLSELDFDDNLHQPIFAIVEVFMDSEETTMDGSGPAATDVAAGSNAEPLGLAELEGTSLLRHISSEKTDFKLSKLVVPVAMVHHRKSLIPTGPRGHSGRLSRPSSGGLDKLTKSNSSSHRDPTTNKHTQLDPSEIVKCLEAGAADVLPSPLNESRIPGLASHAYRAHREASKERVDLLATKRNRKRSWVGFDDKRPHAYLREQMYVSFCWRSLQKLNIKNRVSGLMTGICNPNNVPYTFDLR